jgi:hypothetical protein
MFPFGFGLKFGFKERRKMMKPVLERAASVRRGACPRMSESTTLKENELAGGTSEVHS